MSKEDYILFGLGGVGFTLCLWLLGEVSTRGIICGLVAGIIFIAYGRSR
jgi:hypothetical protein